MVSETAGRGPRRPSTDRRAFLGCLALFGYGGTTRRGVEVDRYPEGRSRDGVSTLTVMTRNLYLGVDLSRLYRAQSADDVRRIAGRMFEDLERRPFPPRAEAIAAEVAATRPDVVGVQEAALVRTRDDSDFAVDATPNAEEGVVDFLSVLLEALSERGLDYEVAASVVTSDVEVPADVDGRVVDVRLTDRDVLLVRRGVDVGQTRTGRYEASLEVSVEDEVVSIDRGYATAAVSVDGQDVTVVTTHLESADATVRLGQALELLDVLSPEEPVVVAGDVNSGPGGSEATYRVLTAFLEDVHSAHRPDADGYTCCQDADLRNDSSRLSRRIDVILSRGLRPIDVERVGEDPDDRVTVRENGLSARLWPSDHAGVVATFEAGSSLQAIDGPATPAVGGTTTRSDRSTTTPRDTLSPSGSPRDRTTGPPMAGFGLVTSVLALLLAAIARRLR